MPGCLDRVHRSPGQLLAETMRAASRRRTAHQDNLAVPGNVSESSPLATKQAGVDLRSRAGPSLPCESFEQALPPRPTFVDNGVALNASRDPLAGRVPQVDPLNLVIRVVSGSECRFLHRRVFVRADDLRIGYSRCRI